MTDPLNINLPLKGVDTTFPLIPESNVLLSVVESNIGENREKDGLQWNLVYQLTNPVESVQGKTIPVTTRVFPDWPLQLQPRADGKGGSSWEGCMAEKSLCATIDAIFGTTIDDRPDFNNALVQSALGRQVTGHIVIDTDKNGVQRNKVTRLTKV